MKKNQLVHKCIKTNVAKKKKKMLNIVNILSAGRLSAIRVFRFYAKNKYQKVCIYAKK